MESRSNFPGPRARELYLEACELPPGERAAWLDGACGADAALRAEVERLLELERRVPKGFLAGDSPPGRLEPGATFAGFRVLSVLGEGGMGTVYAARQALPARDIALKVVRADRWTPEARRRFEKEVQALGSLQHPGIAQIHEAGTARREDSAVDEPYLAMELVRGEPIVAFAQRKGLTARGCIELVARVADAVHHAHLRGVVHRDLKPDNVLVVDGETTGAGGGLRGPGPGQPKVLDFGIARLLGEDGPPETRAGELVGTLAYMSPEQLAGDSSRLDERTDIYALGVLLYQLLAGRLPHDLAGLGLPEALRTLSEEAAVPLGRVAPQHAGDVATIVARALDPQPAQRYASAAALAEDLRRHLRGDPILARSHSTFYLLQRRLQRHRLAVGILLGLSALVAAFAVALGSKSRALAALTASRDESFGRTLSSLSRLRDLAGAMDAKWGVTEVQRELMESVLETHAELLAEHGDDARVRAATAEIRIEVATILDVLGEQDQARDTLLEALRDYELLAREGLDDPMRARAHLRLADVLTTLDRFDEALEQAELAGERFEAGGDRLGKAIAIGQQGETLLRHGAAEPARDRAREALELLAGLEESEEVELARLIPLQIVAQATHHLDGASAAVAAFEELAGRVDEGAREVAPTVHLNLGRVYYEAGRPEDGERHLREAVDRGEELVAASPEEDKTALQLAVALNNLGALCGMTGRDEEAGEHLERALEVLANLMEQHPGAPELVRYHGITQANVGKHRIDRGDPEGGIELLESAAHTLGSLLAGTPEDVDVQEALRIAVTELAYEVGRLGEPERVHAILAPFPPTSDLDMAGRALSIYSMTIGVLRSDESAPPDEVEEQVARLVDGASTLLGRCTEAGFKDHDVLRTNDFFRALRSEPAFATVLKRF